LPTRRSTTVGVVVALAATLLGPYLAVGAVADPVVSSAATTPAVSWIGLITGDQVALDTTGSVVAVRPGAGRERIRLTVQQSGDHLYVVPADAVALIARGLVDRRLFDVALLSRPDYQQQNAAGLAIIVTYRDHHRPLHAAEGLQVEHTYTSINGEALTVTSPSTAWRMLTTEPVIKRVWLDAVPDSLSNSPHRE
jgi:hypothetical protein